MVKIDKRKWAMRPVQLNVPTGPDSYLCEIPPEAFGPDGEGERPAVVVYATVFHRLKQDDVGGHWEATGWGATVAEAVAMVRAQLRKDLASGEYEHNRWWE